MTIFDESAVPSSPIADPIPGQMDERYMKVPTSICITVSRNEFSPAAFQERIQMIRLYLQKSFPAEFSRIVKEESENDSDGRDERNSDTVKEEGSIPDTSLMYNKYHFRIFFKKLTDVTPGETALAKMRRFLDMWKNVPVPKMAMLAPTPLPVSTPAPSAIKDKSSRVNIERRSALSSSGHKSSSDDSTASNQHYSNILNTDNLKYLALGASSDNDDEAGHDDNAYDFEKKAGAYERVSEAERKQWSDISEAAFRNDYNLDDSKVNNLKMHQTDDFTSKNVDGVHINPQLAASKEQIRRIKDVNDENYASYENYVKYARDVHSLAENDEKLNAQDTLDLNPSEKSSSAMKDFIKQQARAKEEMIDKILRKFHENEAASQHPSANDSLTHREVEHENDYNALLPKHGASSVAEQEQNVATQQATGETVPERIVGKTIHLRMYDEETASKVLDDYLIASGHKNSENEDNAEDNEDNSDHQMVVDEQRYNNIPSKLRRYYKLRKQGDSVDEAGSSVGGQHKFLTEEQHLPSSKVAPSTESLRQTCTFTKISLLATRTAPRRVFVPLYLTLILSLLSVVVFAALIRMVKAPYKEKGYRTVKPTQMHFETGVHPL